ncbi:MAG: DUF2189 domain-containing protein [Rhodospirillales bacterium]|jgi:uncharacterized membrane protein|nr:DUF2189 domain-containing protein [Rhodospirillales bacterium]
MNTQVRKGTYQLPVTINEIPEVDRSGRWLSAGWRDFRRTPGVSLAYGGAFVVISFVLVYGLIAAGLGSLVLPLAGGFVMLGPILVVGLYDVSRRLEKSQPARLADVFSNLGDSAGQLSAMGVALLIAFLVWAEVALLLFMMFFNLTPPPLDRFLEEVVFSINGVPLMIVGSLIGAVFGLVVFAISAVSVPLIYDRPIDVVTAISASLLVVRRNWRLMFGWAATIVVVLICGFATFFVGLAVALPVLAYATWHAYRDLIAAEDRLVREPASVVQA